MNNQVIYSISGPETPCYLPAHPEQMTPEEKLQEVCETFGDPANFELTEDENGEPILDIEFQDKLWLVRWNEYTRMFMVTMQPASGNPVPLQPMGEELFYNVLESLVMDKVRLAVEHR